MYNKQEAQVVRLTEIFWNSVEQRLDEDDIRYSHAWRRLRGAIVDAAWKAAKEMSAPCDEGLLTQAKGTAFIIPKEVGVNQTQIQFMGDDGWCEFREPICKHREQVIVKVFGEGIDDERA